ncbi:hypothetical protein C4D60_Mb09t17130 [Musa balbisiana]|uniref:Uncharacterized protein n=1 Tax=Musa balbisiana TaxID=52838 RepID=A0A4S8IID9_MUSBA|nr:hypothetical protein C4D60_Mb09t17130 [Musa balbisiana]
MGEDGVGELPRALRPELRRRPRAGTSRAPATPQPSSPPRQRRLSRPWTWAAATRRPDCLLLRHHGRPTRSSWKQQPDEDVGVGGFI